MPASCITIRDCEERQIPEEQLVTGDLVVISAGAQIPADLRILQSNGLKIENSIITGEKEPFDYTHEAAATYVTVFDARNVAFKGSFCTEGDGIGLVVRTGKYTILGGITSIHKHVRETTSRLKEEINKFVNFISILALIMATFFFLVGSFVTSFQNVLEHFIIGFLIIIVANVPQGLPAMVISQLAIIARRLAKKNVFIKNLDVIDELGAATVIAVDKTGTITHNHVVLTDIWYNRRHHSGRNFGGDQSLNENCTGAEVPSLSLCEQPLCDIFGVMSVCNRAQFEKFRKSERTVSRQRARAKVSEEIAHTGHVTKCFTVVETETGRLSNVSALEKYITSNDSTVPTNENEKITMEHDDIYGSPTDVALLRFVEMSSSVETFRKRYRTVFELPFNSVRRYHLVLAQDMAEPPEKDIHKLSSLANGAVFAIMMKGAPEVVLESCSYLQIGEDRVHIDEELDDECRNTWEHYGDEGRRVFGFAIRRFVAEANAKFTSSDIALEGLTFLGMVGLVDPPRENTAAAIKQCKDAGIKVYMITGDHPTTAMAVARKLGLIAHGDEIVESSTRNRVKLSVLGTKQSNWHQVVGSELDRMDKGGWDELLKNDYIVFARTTPEQKLRIVEECQRRGETVAVTGEGVSDVQALAHANIGIAMGIAGSDIAKQAADLILTDDNFASIVKGIEEGRLLFDNLRLSIAYTLAHLWPEIFPVLLLFTLGLPLGLSPIQILSIDLASELPPSISLAYESPERDIMSVPPRHRDDRLVSRALLIYAYAFAGSIVTFGCIAAYFYVYWSHGLTFRDLLYTADDYWKEGAQNLTVGGYVYSPSEQIYIRRQAAAAWQITLVLAQVFHLYTCTTRRVSFFRHGVTNLVSVFAVIIELLLLNLFIYAPVAQYFLETSSPPSEVWMFGITTGLTILVYNELRKFCIRQWRRNRFVKLISW